MKNADLSEFTDMFLPIFDKHAPKIQKFIRANNCNIITKSLKKALIKRSKLPNKYLRETNRQSKKSI